MKLKCPDCGMQYESGKFCQECGGKLQEVTPELVCPSCGYKAKSGKFCVECGAKLVEQTVPSEPMQCVETIECNFNEKDERFVKYYDKNGFPRTLSQEERDVAIEELTPFANQGNPEAKMLLGFIFLTGKSKGDKIKCVELIQSAAQSGDKLAYYMMGFLYFYGEPLVKHDHDEAEKRLLKVYTEYQSGDAASALAELYIYSKEKCDYKKAFEYATIAADNDEKDGYYVLGALYQSGWGVDKNVEIAFENYKMAAALGDERAMNQIGYIFMGNEGYAENIEQAFYYFNEAAKKGDDAGMYNLGKCYQDGYGVEKDVEKAAEWFKKAAESGYVSAMYELGHYYECILPDPDKSVEWYLKAAELGHVNSQNRLSALYAENSEPNYDEAIKWCREAMSQNHPVAFYNYALLLWNGNGVDEDKAEAMKMMRKAISLGDLKAEEELKEMQNSLSVAENKSVQKNSPQICPKEIHIPEGTKNLSKFVKPDNASNFWKTKVVTLFLPDSLTSVKESILSELRNLQKIIIPKGKVEKFTKMLPNNWWRMYYEDDTHICPGINIPKGDKYVYPYGMTYLTNGSDANGHVLIPPTCTHIEKKAFCNNENILSITMTDSVVSIGNNAFEGCNNMEFIILSNKLQKIPKSMLASCGSLKEVVVPKGVKEIGAGAFSRCGTLSKVVLPSSVETLDNGGLFGCNPFQYSYSLKQIVIPARKMKAFKVLLEGFNGNPAQLLCVEYEKEQVVKKTSSPKVISNSSVECSLPMDEIMKAANASYPKPSLKALAIAALKIAEVIQERLPKEEVYYMVHPSEFDSNVDDDALPIHFLFKKGGVPRVAVVAVTSNGYRATLVQKTAKACEDNNIEYVRVYADGRFADWIEGSADSNTVEFCKNWLVQKINQGL